MTGAAGCNDDGLGFEQGGQFARSEIGDEAGAAVVCDGEIDGERPFPDVDGGAIADGGDEGAFDLGAGGVAAGMEDAAAAVGGFAAEEDVAGRGVAVKVSAGVEEPIDCLGRALDQAANGVGIAESGTGREGVGLMQLGRVVRAERGRETALGVSGVTFAKRTFGKEGDAPRWWEAEGERESGDTSADDDGIVAPPRQGIGPVRSKKRSGETGEIDRWVSDQRCVHGVSVSLTRSAVEGWLANEANGVGEGPVPSRGRLPGCSMGTNPPLSPGGPRALPYAVRLVRSRSLDVHPLMQRS